LIRSRITSGRGLRSKSSRSGKELVERLEDLGYDFFAGVPCSLIEGVLSALDVHPRLPYVAAVREDVAVGLAAGAWLGGKRPAVLFQNSGLGTGLNALASLALLYKLPSLLVVTWRGSGEADAPEHLLTGAITPRLLDLLGIRHRALTPTSVEKDLAWATREADERMEPVALLVPPGVFEDEEPSGSPGKREPSDVERAAGGTVMGPPAARSGVGRVGRASTAGVITGTGPAATLTPVLSRYEALRAVVGCLSNEPVIHANGYVCRESYAISDRQQNFYMIGSMGLASAIGLGLSLARSDVRPVIFDGDGNLLMNLGILPMVGALKPGNFVHVVFDNEVYGSTGNQASISREVRLDQVAAASGYCTARTAATSAEIEAAMGVTLAQDGPHFLLIKVTAHEADVPRIPYPPETIRDRFRSSLGAR
jgi:phosphonopyruvate decarboxylase